MNVNDLKTICRTSEKDMLPFLSVYFQRMGYTDIIYKKDSYLYCKGGKVNVLLNAHADTVHTKLPELIFHDQKEEVIWSPTGIGGDDRCGIYAIMEVVKYSNPDILITLGEERGSTGARAFIKDFKTINSHFIIGLDRRGMQDSVYYDCGNEDFKKFIDKFGFIENQGTFSDISELSPAYQIASVNLSVGYFNEHSSSEYIKYRYLENTISKLIKLLDRKKLVAYDYQSVVSRYVGNYSKDGEETNRWYQWYDKNRSHKVCKQCGITLIWEETEYCSYCMNKFYKFDPKVNPTATTSGSIELLPPETIAKLQPTSGHCLSCGCYLSGTSDLVCSACKEKGIEDEDLPSENKED